MEQKHVGEWDGGTYYIAIQGEGRKGAETGGSVVFEIKGGA